MQMICDKAGDFDGCSSCYHGKPHLEELLCKSWVNVPPKKVCNIKKDIWCIPVEEKKMEKELVVCPNKDTTDNCSKCPHGEPHEQELYCTRGCTCMDDGGACIPATKPIRVECDMAAVLNECEICPHRHVHHPTENCDKPHQCPFSEEIVVECFEVMDEKPSKKDAAKLKQYFVVGFTNVAEDVIFEDIHDIPWCSDNPDHDSIFNGLDCSVVKYCPLCGANMELKSIKKIREVFKNNHIIRLHEDTDTPIYFIGSSFGVVLDKSCLIDLDYLYKYPTKESNSKMAYVDALDNLDPDKTHYYSCGIVYGEMIQNPE